MGGSSKKQTVGYKYYLGAHMYLGHSEFDKITKIRVANKTAWQGEAMDEQIYINAPKAFGGEEREGGIVGYVDVLSGKSDQTVNSYLSSVQPVSGEDIPAYRGKTSLVLRQPYMGTNPYMKNWQVTGQRIHKTTGGSIQWYDEKSEVFDFSEDVDGFTETFADNLDSYALQAGSLSAFTIDGAWIDIDPVTSPFDAIKRSIPEVGGVISGISFKFIINDVSTDDSTVIKLLDSESNVLFSFIPVREQAADPLRRAHLNAPSNGSGAIITSSQLSTGIEYYFYASTGNGEQYTATIYQGSTEVGSVSGDFFNSIEGTADLYFEAPNLSSLGGSASYSEITIYYSVSTSDMNPAHIIRECLTDTRFGLGYTSSDIDDAAFMSAADALYNEGFGLSFYWNNDQEIEEFIRNILRHIDATLYVDHTTGKFVLKLIRDDYAIESLTTIDQTNVVSISDYKKPTISELTNYVTVNFWDRSTYEDSSISVQDIALAQMQGSVVSTTIDYDGVTRGALASKIASRDLAALSNPLIVCSITANREAATLNNGDAFLLNWPKYGISNVVMRVSDINFGELADGKVRIKAVQDVFALPAAIYSQPEDSGWTAVVNDPTAITNQMAQETPYWLLIQDQGEDFAPDALDGYLMTAAGQPSSDSIRYRIWTDETGDYVEQEYADFCPTATIDHDWPKANNGTLQKTVNVTGIDAEDIDQIDIGSAASINGEWLGVVSITPTGANTAICEFDRSVADTSIADHTSGDRIYFFGSSLYGTDNTLFQDSDAINVKLTPQTGNGQLDVADATAIALTFDQRAYRAYPPANIKLNTVYFPYQITDTGSVDSTWSHRDRLLQTAGLIDFDEASIGPESSTTYTTTLYRVNNETVLDTNTGLTGTSDSLDPGGYDGLVRYEIKSVRDSLDSFYSQSHQFVVSRTKPLQEESLGDFLYTEDLEIIMTES